MPLPNLTGVCLLVLSLITAGQSGQPKPAATPAPSNGVTPPPTEKPAIPGQGQDDLHVTGGGHPSVPEPAADWPKAKAEDVGSIDTIIAAYYASTAGGVKQPRDWDRFRSLFEPDAHLVAARQRGDGSAGVVYLTPDQFAVVNAKYFERGGYFENEVAHRVERFGSIAHVWSTYESRRGTATSERYTRGINSFQLFNDGARWWIVSAVWDFERANVTIPEKYTHTPTE